MISDESLIALNYRGFIPGPNEKEEDFLSRVSYSEKLFFDPIAFFSSEERNFFSFLNKVKKPRWSWTRSCLTHLFDFSPDSFLAFFDNRSLPFYQGGATWILEKEAEKIQLPLIQVRKELERKALFNLYTLEEILSHESAHAARVAFDEKEFEVIFAYWSSSSTVRRIFGPLFSSTTAVAFFLFSLIGMVLFQILYLLLSLSLFSFGHLLCAFLCGSLSLFSLVKLFWSRRALKKAAKKLLGLLNSKKTVRFVLFRLTDQEIHRFSSFSSARILEFVKKNSSSSLRWRMIRLCYFPFL